MIPPIFIVGYMASGKTTFGKALARKTGLQHIDLDFYIEQRFHCSVSEFFATRGEAEFRRVESNLLREVGEFCDVVISCGGGTPCFADNMEYMNRRGLTVCLKASDDVVADRIINAGDKRPLMARKSREEILASIAEHKLQRTPFYDKARITISGDNLESKARIADTVDAFISRYLPDFSAAHEEC